MLKGRQVGASTCVAMLAVSTAKSAAGVDVVIVSPSQRQSSEITQKCRLALWELGDKLRADSAGMVQLANGSRIISLPGSARGIRGYAPMLAIADEASWIDDSVYDAMRPMVAASGGRMIVLSTPGIEGVGFFHGLATDTPGHWRRMVVPSTSVPTIDPEFLAREKAHLKAHVYASEYEAQFIPVTAALREGTWFKPSQFDERVDPRFKALDF